MQILLIIILVAIVYFVVYPTVRVYMAMRRAQKQAREFFEGGGQSQRGPRQNTRGRGYAPRKGKKIDPNVGEYVEFEEIPTQQNQPNTTTEEVNFKVESQIEDVEWEDVK